MNRRLSLFRHLPGSLRRATAEPPVSIALDQWLDTQMPGPSTPGKDIATPSLSEADRAEVAALSATFRQIGHLEGRTSADSNGRLQAQCWEDIMNATIPAPATATTSPAFNPSLGTTSHRPTRSTQSRWQDQPSRIGGFARISPVLNVAMAALLVVVLGLSAWALMGTRPGGSDGGPGGTEAPAGLASLAAQDPPATPVAQSVLPTADECTITPLTIDQVMQRIKGASPTYSKDGKYVATPNYVLENAMGTPVMSRNVPPSQQDIDEIAAVQREFVACSIKGDLLRVWAFYSPNSPFWLNFLQYYPRFADEATVRADIETYVSKPYPNGLPNGLPGLGWDAPQSESRIPNTPLVNPNPQESLIQDSAETTKGRQAAIEVAMNYYTLGNPDAVPQYIPRDQMARNWVYIWDQASGTWMIYVVGLDVNRG